jgi:hypothetical protein
MERHELDAEEPYLLDSNPVSQEAHGPGLLGKLSEFYITPIRDLNT